MLKMVAVLPARLITVSLGLKRECEIAFHIWDTNPVHYLLSARMLSCSQNSSPELSVLELVGILSLSSITFGILVEKDRPVHKVF